VLFRHGTRLYTCNGLDNTASIIGATAQQAVVTIPGGKRLWGVVLDD
jgi:YVTN family beta-propeller protein